MAGLDPRGTPAAAVTGLHAPWFVLLMLGGCLASSVLGFMSHDGLIAWAISVNFIAVCAVTGVRFRLPRLRVTGPAGDVEVSPSTEVPAGSSGEQRAA